VFVAAASRGGRGGGTVGLELELCRPDVEAVEVDADEDGLLFSSGRGGRMRTPPATGVEGELGEAEGLETLLLRGERRMKDEDLKEGLGGGDEVGDEGLVDSSSGTETLRLAFSPGDVRNMRIDPANFFIFRPSRGTTIGSSSSSPSLSLSFYCSSLSIFFDLFSSSRACRGDLG
jgi:hypothetical protein